MKSKLVVVFALAALASIAAAQSPVFQGTCNISQVSYSATETVSRTTVSKTFTDVPNTVLFFPVNIGGCLRIEFSASIVWESEASLVVRVLFDQNPSLVILPSELRLHPTSDGRHFMLSFVLPLEDGLGPGIHNVRIQWRSPEPSNIVVSKQSVIVDHN